VANGFLFSQNVELLGMLERLNISQW